MNLLLMTLPPFQLLEAFCADGDKFDATLPYTFNGAGGNDNAHFAAAVTNVPPYDNFRDGQKSRACAAGSVKAVRALLFAG